MRFPGLLLILSLLSGLSLVQGAQAQEGTRTPATPTAGQATASAPAGTPGTVVPQSTPTPLAAIREPIAGQALQGVVTVSGLISATQFTQAELAFAYLEDRTDTWFILQQFAAQPGPFQVDWDTTTITDGEYNLRLVLSGDGIETSSLELAALRVRNYTPIETSTPTPPTPSATSLPGDTAVPSPTATATGTPLPPTPTPFPPNPLQVTPPRIVASLGTGALAALALFAIVQLYVLLRRIR